MSRSVYQIILVAWLMIGVCPLLSAERPKIGIFEFEVSENVAPGISGFLYFALVERMVASGKHTVVDWEEIDRKRQYIAKSQPTISEEDAKHQAMHELGIEQMYVGAVQKIGERYRIGVKVLNLDLTVAAAEGEWASGEEGLEGAIDRLTARLLTSPKEQAVAKREAMARESPSSSKGRLSVQATPVDARVRILNIKPRYRPGIELEAGSYHIEVSKPGYVTARQWIRIAGGDDRVLEIALEVGEAPASKSAFGVAEKREIEAAYNSAVAKGNVPISLALRYLVVKHPMRHDETAFQQALAAFDRGDFETAGRGFRQLAEQGIPQAQYALARMYASGEGVPQNDSEAAKWYRRAAEQGIAQAQYNLAAMYAQGHGVAQDDAEALRWYRMAAEQGQALAQFTLGHMYREGQGVAQDYREAVRWYRMVAEQGYAGAQSDLGAVAQFNLGLMYRDGLGVGQNDIEALRWFRKAADQGDGDAQNDVGWMYANGRGVGQDDAEAVRWYRMAAEQGHAVAQFNLGVMYRDGYGVGQNDIEALRWFRKAADQGYGDAQNDLGRMYANGQGVGRDDAEAVRWYRKSAEQGNRWGQNNLGVMYFQGRGVGQDDAEALRWFLKAAAQEDAWAQNNLGVMYEYGRGVGRDVSEAVRWYRKAAEQGHADAQSALQRLCHRRLFPPAACKEPSASRQ